MDTEKHIQLLNKYLDNQCSDEELIELFEWINSEEGNADLDLHLNNQIESGVDENLIISEENRKKSLRKLKKQIGLKRSLAFHLKTWQKYAAIFITCTLIGGTFWTFPHYTKTENGQIIFSMDRNNKGHLTLADGSNIFLNSESTITYSAKSARDIQLQGEAFIHVTKDKKNPFVVHTPHLDVVVYGTTFNVTAYPNNPNISISLIEGSVGIKLTNKKNVTYITPGQTANYNVLTKQLSLVSENMKDVALWRQDELIIKNATVPELCAKIESWYGVEVKLLNQPKKTHLYNMSLRHESINEVLELINTVTPITYKVNGREVTIEYMK